MLSLDGETRKAKDRSSNLRQLETYILLQSNQLSLCAKNFEENLKINMNIITYEIYSMGCI